MKTTSKNLSLTLFAISITWWFALALTALICNATAGGNVIVTNVGVITQQISLLVMLISIWMIFMLFRNTNKHIAFVASMLSISIIWLGLWITSWFVIWTVLWQICNFLVIAPLAMMYIAHVAKNEFNSLFGGIAILSAIIWLAAWIAGWIILFEIMAFIETTFIAISMMLIYANIWQDTNEQPQYKQNQHN